MEHLLYIHSSVKIRLSKLQGVLYFARFSYSPLFHLTDNMVSYWRFVQDYHISSIDGRGSRAVPSPPQLIYRLPSPLRNSIHENFSQSIIHFTRFFPKQFPQKFFPGLSQKNFPAHTINARFAIFQKCRIASFAGFLHPIPTSCSRPKKPGRFFDFHFGFGKKIRAGRQVLIVAILTCTPKLI